MAHSFGVVEEKLHEAEFLLERFSGTAPYSFDARCYFSAFISAARSVTFALQFSMSGVQGFAEWYADAQRKLKSDALAPHFVEMRNDVQKKSVNRLNEVPAVHLKEYLTHRRAGSSGAVLILPNAKSETRAEVVDALAASTSYFRTLAALVYDAYEEFKTVVDPRWYFTRANFQASGRTIEDALEELGFPRTWLDALPAGANEWRLLRIQQPSCALNELFEKYLTKRIADPEDCA